MMSVIDTDQTLDDGDNSITQQEDVYKSSEFLLPYILKECEREGLRAKDITTKIPILITIATFFAGYVFKENPIALEVFKENFKLCMFYSVMYFVCFSGIVSSIGIFIWIMCSRKYKRMDIDKFLQPIAHKSESGLVAYELACAYTEVYKYNVKVNDKKIKWYNISIGLLVLSVVVYIIIQFVIFMYK